MYLVVCDIECNGTSQGFPEIAVSSIVRLSGMPSNELRAVIKGRPLPSSGALA